MIWIITIVLALAIAAYLVAKSPIVEGCTYCERWPECDDCPLNPDYVAPPPEPRVTHHEAQQIDLVDTCDAAIEDLRCISRSLPRERRRRVMELIAEHSRRLDAHKRALGFEVRDAQ
jgi:hypothetical protein